ncbi:MAG: hypothetical protein R3E90_14780 [Marinicella sp.]
MNKNNLLEIKKFYTKKNLNVYWASACEENQFEAFQTEHKLQLTQQLKCFYEFSNGFSVSNPEMKIYSIEELKLNSGLLEFCEINSNQKFGFDLSSTRVDDQWDIYHINSNTVITYTFASFLFNKVNKWLIKNKEFWSE